MEALEVLEVVGPRYKAAGSLNLTTSSLSQDQAQQIVANPAGFYFNVHTNANPTGAVRGQLTRQ